MLKMPSQVRADVMLDVFIMERFNAGDEKI